jgi:hypothetical protein
VARYRVEKNTRLSIGYLGIKKLTRTLENWWELNFEEFLAELAKHKVKLRKKDHAEWQEFLDDETKQHAIFSLQITELELQLNQAVYALFDLTAEEINLIEAN